MSGNFYRALLAKEPELDVPGMTEFRLSNNCKLGLMPADGIKRLLGNSIPDTTNRGNFPGAELYLMVENSDEAMAHALKTGAVLLDAVSNRDWGHRVGYVSDPDGYVIAFAQNNP
ncbi:MAG: glyoxalase [Bacteroidetes bacterium HGW-Bacteroidetes-6]|nr:MAG: glyoxalase [Bacteroidetes bacterium HGW-Bacteroidetes-6]